LRTLLIGHVETAIGHIDAATVFLNEWRYLDDRPRDVIQQKRDRYESMVQRLIDEGIHSGDFRADADVRFAVLLVLSAGNWVYEWYRPDGALGPTEIGERFARLIVGGLEAEEARR
jgi:TetR/AcrR family transcriptional regulator, cholesterol catabolism regulator